MKLKRVLAVIMAAVTMLCSTIVNASAATTDYYKESEFLKGYDLYDLINFAKTTTNTEEKYLDPSVKTELKSQKFDRLKGTGSHLCFCAYEINLKKSDKITANIEVVKTFQTPGIWNGVGVFLVDSEDNLLMTPDDFWFTRRSQYGNTKTSFTTPTVPKGRYYIMLVTQSSTVGNFKITFTAKKSLETKPEFSAKALGDKKVKITWSKVSGATKYRICKLKTNNKDWQVVKDKISKSKTSYTISSGLIKGNVYKYGVQAYVNGKWTSLKPLDAVQVTVK